MSWVDKAHRKHNQEKLIKEMMRTKQYQEDKYQMYLQGFMCMALISVDFMMRKHNYGKKRIKEYVDFLEKCMGYVMEDEEYFKLLNQEIERDTGINVLDQLGIQVK